MRLLAYITTFVLATLSFSQTILAPGDVALTSYHSDTPDMFSFVLLVDVTNGTELRFADHGWLAGGGFRNTEGNLGWKATSDLPAGTQVFYDGAAGAFNIGDTAPDGSFALSTTGDQLFIFQGVEASPTILAGIQMASGAWDIDATSSNTSAEPPGITAGAFNLVLAPEVDNALYLNTVTNGTQADILTALNDPTNWKLDDDPRTDLPPGGPGFTYTVVPVCDTSNVTAAWKWNGSTSNDWFECANWDNGSIPGINADVAIPAGVPNYPEITGRDAHCRRININTDGGAQLSVDVDGGFQLFITN